MVPVPLAVVAPVITQTMEVTSEGSELIVTAKGLTMAPQSPASLFTERLEGQVMSGGVASLITTLKH